MLIKYLLEQTNAKVDRHHPHSDTFGPYTIRVRSV